MVMPESSSKNRLELSLWNCIGKYSMSGFGVSDRILGMGLSPIERVREYIL